MLFLVEYYTKNPATGEGGWDLKFAWVRIPGQQDLVDGLLRHECREIVLAAMKAHVEDFDEIIQMGQHSEEVWLGEGVVARRVMAEKPTKTCVASMETVFSNF